MKIAFAILDVESNEELMRIILEYPLAQYSDIETFAVTEYDTAAKILKELASSNKYY
jgi:hypothetical protein